MEKKLCHKGDLELNFNFKWWFKKKILCAKVLFVVGWLEKYEITYLQAGGLVYRWHWSLVPKQKD